MNWLSLRNNGLKFKTAGKLPIILEEFSEYTPHFIKETGGCRHVNGCTCKHYYLNWLCPKISPITDFHTGNTRILTAYAQNPPWTWAFLPMTTQEDKIPFLIHFPLISVKLILFVFFLVKTIFVCRQAFVIFYFLVKTFFVCRQACVIFASSLYSHARFPSHGKN